MELTISAVAVRGVSARIVARRRWRRGVDSVIVVLW